MNQPWIYMYSPFQSPFLPPSPPHPSGSSQCTSPEHLFHASNLGWWSVSPLIIYMNSIETCILSRVKSDSMQPDWYSVRHSQCVYSCAGLPWGSVVKNTPANAEDVVRSQGWEEPLVNEMAIHSSILAWEIPWTEESCGLQSMRSQKSWTQLSD